MAKVVDAASNRIQLDNGSIVNANPGGWYDGQQYWGGQLGASNVIINPNQQGYQQQVSKEVVDQSGSNNWAYLQGKQNQGGGAPSGGAGVPGGGGGMPSMPQSPTIDIKSIYDAAFGSQEIKDLTTKLTEQENLINQRKKQLAEAEALINDNPWYSEATRVGKVSKLREKANADINTLSDEYNSYSNQLKNLRTDAEIKVNLELKQYDINNAEYQKNLDRLNFLISSGAITNASADDLSSIAAATGVSPTMIQGIITKAKNDGKQPHVITSEDNNGNVTVSVVDLLTGEVINQNSLGKIGSDSTTAGGAGGLDRKSVV